MTNTDDLPAIGKWMRTLGGDVDPAVADRMAEAIHDGLMAIGSGLEHTALRMRVTLKVLAQLMARFEDQMAAADRAHLVPDLVLQGREGLDQVLDGLPAYLRIEMRRFRRALAKDVRGARAGH